MDDGKNGEEERTASDGPLELFGVCSRATALPQKVLRETMIGKGRKSSKYHCIEISCCSVKLTTNELVVVFQLP